eukprot:TRINITY_DN32935_c0_g1_i1.p1 TRINITY_DN32935_c0_g1~~TRINITY_DN32935_c0_g1_i1.p1  ORF type:complete len:456 (-),score=50.78 TRINITY_DN32935_c0_g1_i1:121-1419(-)
MEDRMRETVAQYTRQGVHRTATSVDTLSAAWLADRMEQITGGAAQVRQKSFPTRRLTPSAGSISFRTADGSTQTIDDGLPMFDCATYTGLEGISGKLGFAGQDCDIAVVRYSDSNDPAPTSEFMQARTSSRHLAVIATCDSCSSGLPVVNAQRFLDGGVGRPTLLLDSKHYETLCKAAERYVDAHLVASMHQETAEAINVEAEVTGTDPCLAPLLLITPRSGWWNCAVERGASLAAFLEVLQMVAASKPKRTCLFSANTGHELGHIGLHHFVSERPSYMKQAHVCIHFGANWGSVHVNEKDRAVLLQISNDTLQSVAEKALFRHGLDYARFSIVPGNKRPFGEARELYDFGANYVSMIGMQNLEFHTKEDVESCLNLPLLVKLTAAMKDIVRHKMTEDAQKKTAADGLTSDGGVGDGGRERSRSRERAKSKL